jgi:putative nucleotidyltransferase with HDIG domain
MSVPALPTVATRALRLLSNEDARLLELYHVIESDPGFASEVLRIANSPVYGQATPVKSLIQAAMLLGFDRLRGAVVTVGIRSYVANLLAIPSLEACWRHSLACAIIGEHFAQSLSIRPDDVFTAGIMHDIGRLALAAIHPKKYSEFLAKASLEPCDALQEEARLFGMDHCRVGCLLVENWDLPAEFTDVVGHHHDTERPFALDVAGVVRCACRFADVLGFQVVQPMEPVSYEHLLAEIPDSYREMFTFDPIEMAHSIDNKIRSLASAS